MAARRLEEALEQLLEQAEDAERSEVLLLQSRLADLTRAEHRGTISAADAAVERNRIGLAVLELGNRRF